MAAPDITVCVASFNTRAATELCVRSILRLAKHPLSLRVGDSGSTDGSVATLAQFADRGLITVEVAPEGRNHAEWLDHWRSACDSKYILFVDSDLEFRRAGWLGFLDAIVRRDSPAIAYAEWLPESVFTIDGRVARVVARPAPWLLLLDTQQTSGLEASFAVRYSDMDSGSRSPVIHDVGAALYYEAVDQGLSTLALPRAYQRQYHHYGGLSWLPTGGPRGQKKLRDERTVERRLAVSRRLDMSTAALPRRIAATQLAAFPQDVLEAAFRVRAGVGRRYRQRIDRSGR
jgi:glycosyltransferase involved in cell wall biosynthesis